SSFKLYGSSGWPWQEQGPWELSHRVLNTGTETCIVQSDQLTGAPVAIEAGRDLTRTAFASTKPKLIRRDIRLGRCARPDACSAFLLRDTRLELPSHQT